MRKKIALIAALVMVLLLSGCVSNNQSAENVNVTAAPAVEQTATAPENPSSAAVVETPAQASVFENVSVNGTFQTVNATATPQGNISSNVSSEALVSTNASSPGNTSR